MTGMGGETKRELGRLRERLSNSEKKLRVPAQQRTYGAPPYEKLTSERKGYPRER